MDEEYFLYRQFDHAGALLYVGISRDWASRLRGHARTASWFSRIGSVTITRFPNRFCAALAEAEAIAGEKPLFNRTDLPEVRQWVTDRCHTADPKVRCRASEMHADYRTWCELRGHQSETATAFGRSLRAMGFVVMKDGRGNRCWIGIAVKERRVDGQLARPSVLLTGAGPDCVERGSIDVQGEREVPDFDP